MIHLQFHGAAGMVTGSKHLITTPKGRKILLDCGMFQGRGAKTDQMNRHFGFNPSEIDAVVLSHAHIDHSGLLPRLVKLGFRGPIYATPATLDLCGIMLRDAAHIQMSDTEYLNDIRGNAGKDFLEPLYTFQDAEHALELFVSVPYLESCEIFDDVHFQFTDAGHILGSAAVHLRLMDENRWIHLSYSGDVGRYVNRILRVPQPVPAADYIIMESTYGDRLHPPFEELEAQFLRIVRETCVVKGGKLIIPAFSVGRTQEVVNVLNNLEFEGKLPPIPVYVDSPMATEATEVYRKYSELFNPAVRLYMLEDPTPFAFSKLRYTRSVDESKALNHLKEPCIIISASGMAEAGRIKHHLLNHLSDGRNTVLLVGWATPSSLAGRLKNGDRRVSIFGREVSVDAHIESLDPFSAHGDWQEMLRFLDQFPKEQIRKLFLVHGDDSVLPVWKSHLEGHGYNHIEIPNLGQTYTINP